MLSREQGWGHARAALRQLAERVPEGAARAAGTAHGAGRPRGGGGTLGSPRPFHVFNLHDTQSSGSIN